MEIKRAIQEILRNTNGAVFGFLSGTAITLILAYFLFTGEDFISFLKTVRITWEIGLFIHFAFCKIKPKTTTKINFDAMKAKENKDNKGKK